MERRLLFLPGAGGDPEFWRGVGAHLSAHLSARWAFRFPGWPGLGDQPAQAGVNGLDDLVDQAEAILLTGFDDPGPVDVLAQSMGGIVAIRLALRHPGRVRRLVLTATSGGLDVAGLGGADWRPAYRAAYPGAAAWITQVRADHEPDLARLALPVLLLWGTADPVSPVAVGERLLALLPDARLCLIAGGDHGFVADRAAEVAALVAPFLA